MRVQGGHKEGYPVEAAPCNQRLGTQGAVEGSACTAGT